MFTVQARDPNSRARTGTLHLAHGEVRTPAFVPLATKGAVKTLEPRDVVALGYEMVLGNTFHLLLAPGSGARRRVGRPATSSCAGTRPIITDSGGFQVFSMGHGGVADEIKGAVAAARARVIGRPAPAPSCRSTRRASASVPTSTVASGSLSPETSMSVQAALGSDIALVFDECTPFHVSREYTERSMERTHRWLERCLRWHARDGRRGQAVYGIVQGGVEPICGSNRPQAVAAQRLRRDRDRRLARPGQGADA